MLRRRKKVLLAVLSIPCLIAAYLFIKSYLGLGFTDLKMPEAVDTNRACSRCQRPRVVEGAEYVSMEDTANSTDGCAQLKLICGLDRGTQAIIQWSFDGLDLDVPFNDREDQTKIERTLKCDDRSTWILEENDAAEAVNELFVAHL